MDHAPNRWLRHTAALCARTVLATLAGLLVWSVLPAVVGWQPTVVLSGSMEPAIRTGDVVVTRELPPGELRPGHVLLAEDPSGSGGLLLHRYESAEDGTIVLRGDANDAPDSAPVTAEAVHGVGVLRVPWVGLPYAWLVGGQYLPVVLTGLGLAACARLARVRERESRRHAAGRTVAWRGWRPVAAASLLAVAVPGAAATDARAGFTSSVAFPVTFTTTGAAGP